MVLSGAWRTVAACSTQLTCRFTYMATKQKSWPTCCFNLEMLRLICRVGNKLANNKSCRTCWTTLRTSSTTSCQLVLANKLSNKLAKWNLDLTYTQVFTTPCLILRIIVTTRFTLCRKNVTLFTLVPYLTEFIQFCEFLDKHFLLKIFVQICLPIAMLIRILSIIVIITTTNNN